MHWVLQENLFKEAEFEQLTACLDRFELPYTLHKVIPFIGELMPPVQPQSEKVICLGSYSMRHSAKLFKWSPGVYDLEPFNFSVQLERWGAEEMLNGDSRVVKFKDAVVDEVLFIRPIDDSKHFAGGVFEPAEFADWQRNVCVLEHDYGSSLSGETLIQLARPKRIYAEYRFWVVDGKIVTASLYKRGSRVTYSTDVPEVFHDYVRERIAEWQPHRAFVIDVCDTSDGVKVVEINTLNAAGFYAADMQKLVIALEELEA